MSAERGPIVEDMMGATLFKRAPVGTSLRRQGETACLTARMDAALLGENPNTLMDEAEGIVAELESDQKVRVHRAEDHRLAQEEKTLAEDEYDFQARQGEPPVRDAYGFSARPPVKGW